MAVIRIFIFSDEFVYVVQFSIFLLYETIEMKFCFVLISRISRMRKKRECFYLFRSIKIAIMNKLE